MSEVIAPDGKVLTFDVNQKPEDVVKDYMKGRKSKKEDTKEKEKNKK